jgi:hypothetical protein
MENLITYPKHRIKEFTIAVNDAAFRIIGDSFGRYLKSRTIADKQLYIDDVLSLRRNAVVSDKRYYLKIFLYPIKEFYDLAALFM